MDRPCKTGLTYIDSICSCSTFSATRVSDKFEFCGKIRVDLFGDLRDLIQVFPDVPAVVLGAS